MKKATIRVRLTLLYGGLFLVAGVILLGVTYLLVKQTVAPPGKGALIISKTDLTFTAGEPKIQLSNGQAVTPEQAAGAIEAQQIQFQQHTLNSLLTRGSIALGVVGIGALGFGWIIADRALRPVGQITATARRVAAATSAHRGLHERIGLGGPQDEIKQLADTFDDMLERLDRSFDGQRRFVANASHELRTPLAINRALLEVTASRPDSSAETRQLADTLLSVNARHERLIDGLLTLADSESQLTDRTALNLADVAQHVIDQTDAGTITVGRGDLLPAPVHGDPMLLERLVQNLVDNAIRHNTPDGWFRVVTDARDGNAVLTVTNTGPVVAPYDIPAIFEPFRRLAAPRTRSDRGLGLGLSIVRAIARAHNGEATAAPRPGGGLEVTIRLPVIAPESP
jgi:signal transduction histidine kinase